MAVDRIKPRPTRKVMAPSSVKIEMVMLTPDLAQKLLDANENNRRVRESIKQSYVVAMQRGEFPFTGDTIKIGVSGKLLDGQHRCLAVIESKVSIQTIMVTGLPDEVQAMVDVGAPRSSGDWLRMQGYPSYSGLAAMAKYVVAYEETGRFSGARNFKITNIRIEDRVAQDPEVLDHSVKLGQAANRGCNMPASFAAAIHYTLARINAEKADEFFAALISGADLPKGSPILTLRDKSQQLKSNRQTYAIEFWHSMAFRSWNAWRTNKEMLNIRIFDNNQRMIPAPSPHK